MNENLAYILGVLVGDGYLKERSIGLNVKDKDFALNFKNIFEKEFNKKGKLHLYELWKIEFHSVNLVKFFRNYNYFKVKDHSNIIKGAFLRGFYDSEGSVYYKIKRGTGRSDRKIELCNTNLKLLIFCKELLEDLNIFTRKIDKRIRKPRLLKGRLLPTCIYYRFNLSENKENFIRFKSLVGFSIKRKQEILNGLINSYLPSLSKWHFEREQVLNLRKLKSYKEIINQFKHIPKSTIEGWLYDRYNKWKNRQQTRLLDINHKI